MAADHSEARVAGYLSSVGVTRRSSRHYIGQHTSTFALQNDVAIFRRCSYATITDSTGTMWVFIAPGGGSQGQAAAGAARLVLGEPPTQSPSPGTPRSASSPATLPNTATPPPAKRVHQKWFAAWPLGVSAETGLPQGHYGRPVPRPDHPAESLPGWVWNRFDALWENGFCGAEPLLCTNQQG